jgi:hypothetical protein
MAQGLRRDPAVKEVLAGDHRQAVEDLLKPPPGISDPHESVDEGIQWILSADLKTATDLIGSETYEAICDGILASKPGQTLPPWARRHLLLSVGRQLLSYKELGRHTATKRGALMGLPTTWPLLCLCNLAWWKASEGKPEPRVDLRICGDDLVAKSTKDRISRYESRAADSGAKFSDPSKHMVLQGGGVFTEEVFFTTGPARVVPEGPTRRRYGYVAEPKLRGLQIRNLFRRWSEAFPLRGLLGTMRSDLTGREAPYWSAIGPAIEQMMADRTEETRTRMLRTFRYAHPEFRTFARNAGMAAMIHVPRQFGGFGIPTPKMWDWAPELKNGNRRTVLAAKALALGLEPAGDQGLLSRPWSDLNAKVPWRTIAKGPSQRGLDARYEFVKASRATELPITSIIYPGTVDGLQETVEANVARDLFFLSDAPLTSEQGLHRNSMDLLKKLRSRLATSRDEVLQTLGGWLLAKQGQHHQEGNQMTWAELLRTLKDKADQRVALLRPGTERDIRIPFERLETILSMNRHYSPFGGPMRSIPLWELPLREWPSRPAEKALSSLLSSLPIE